MNDIIRVKNLTKVYRFGKEKNFVLNNISFSINKGEFIAITGASGSGKSTLLYILSGLERATGGELHVCALDLRKMSEDELVAFRSKNIGFVFQSFNLIPNLTALENVAFPLFLKGVGKERRLARAKKLLDKFNLGNRLDYFPNQLSGGQQQRISIARALIADPQIIFADEPTGNLDTKNGEEIVDYLLETIFQKKKTLLLVTHDEKLARKADRIISIEDGRIIRDFRKEDE